MAHHDAVEARSPRHAHLFGVLGDALRERSAGRMLGVDEERELQTYSSSGRQPVFSAHSAAAS